MRRLLLALMCLTCLFANPTKAEALRVGVFGQAPFVINDQGVLSGISVDLWYEVTQNMGIETQTRYFDDVDVALGQLETNNIDVLIGPIAITANRATKFSFTQPYFRAGLGIAVHDDPLTSWQRVRPLLSKTAAALVAYIAIFLVLVGILIWRIERKRNPDQFPMEKRKGIGSGIWFAMVTMTGVGYGDKTPVTTLGRIVSSIWMVTAIIMFSSVTAAITTSFTVSAIPQDETLTPSELSGKRVAVFSERASQLLSSVYHARPQKVLTFDAAFDLLRSREIEAVVSDQAELMNYLKNHPSTPAITTESVFNAIHFGFAFAGKTPKYLDTVNVNLLKLIENDRIQDIFVRWTGHKQDTN
jgi:polar amino acid transport system substrate-binding protein